MTREEAIEYWEQFNAEIDDLYDACSDADRDVLVKQREIVEYTISALRQQEPNDWICTLKCTALMDEGMCSHGGLCCLYESQRTIKENQPLTLDELRQMDGEPVWCEIYIKGQPSFYGIVHGENVTGFIPGDDKPANLAITNVGAYGFAWLAYRQKPEEPVTDSHQMTNADRINAMSIEEKEDFLFEIAYGRETPWCEQFAEKFCKSCPTTTCTVEGYHHPIDLHECDFTDGKCPHGGDIVWWLQQPVEDGANG